MPATYRLATYMHNGAGNFFQNVFSYELSEAGSGVGAFEYADALIAAYISHTQTDYLGLFGSDVVLDYYTAKRITGAGGVSASRASGEVGAAAGLCSTAGASADVQWQTNSPLNRPGHSYIASFPSGSIQGDVFTAAYGLKISAWITKMLAVMPLAGALGDAVFKIYSRKGDISYTVNSGILRPKATMMNRRLSPQI